MVGGPSLCRCAVQPTNDHIGCDMSLAGVLRDMERSVEGAIVYNLTLQQYRTTPGSKNPQASQAWTAERVKPIVGGALPTAPPCYGQPPQTELRVLL